MQEAIVRKMFDFVNHNLPIVAMWSVTYQSKTVSYFL